MKVSFVPFGKPGTDAPAALPELARQHGTIARLVAPLLREYGIHEVELALVPAGAVPVRQAKFRTFRDASVPENLKLARNTLVRDCLMGLMSLYGISKFSIALTDAEYLEIESYWQYLRTGDVAAFEARSAGAPAAGESNLMPGLPPVQIEDCYGKSEEK